MAETYSAIVVEARDLDEWEASQDARSAELAAFDAAYLQEHGCWPALCDLPEHLIHVATK